MFGFTQWLRFLLNFHLNVGIKGTKCSTLGAVNVLIFVFSYIVYLSQSRIFSDIFFYLNIFKNGLTLFCAEVKKIVSNRFWTFSSRKRRERGAVCCWIRSCASPFPAHCTRHSAARPPLPGRGVWFGLGLVWFGLVWVGFGLLTHSTRHSAARPPLPRRGGLVLFGLVWGWFCLVWFGLVWFGSVSDFQHAVRGTLRRDPHSQVWFGLVWFGSVSARPPLPGRGVWFGLVWIGFGLLTCCMRHSAARSPPR